VRKPETEDLLGITPDGRGLRPIQLVMPLAIDYGSDKLSAFGTCFPIFARQNIFVTARHVFEGLPIQIEDDSMGTFHSESGTQLVAGCFHSIGAAGRLGWLLRPVARLWRHKTADLALGLFFGINLLRLGRPLIDIVPHRDFSLPRVDGLVTTFAYPNLTGETTSVELSRRVTEVRTVRMGFVNQVYPAGRDRLMLPEACMETSLDIRGGMSGGPVFNAEGRLCGVNSTSLEEHQDSPPVAFVSLLNPLLDMTLPDTRTREMFAIRRLIEMGF